jgi:hypothetical protein
MNTCEWCSVVAREALREVRGLGFQPHGARSVEILREKYHDRNFQTFI